MLSIAAMSYRCVCWDSLRKSALFLSRSPFYPWGSSVYPQTMKKALHFCQNPLRICKRVLHTWWKEPYISVEISPLPTKPYLSAKRHPQMRKSDMGWLWLVGSLKLQVSFVEYSVFYRALLQKRPIILWSLLVIATPYAYLRYLYTWRYKSKRDVNNPCISGKRPIYTQINPACPPKRPSYPEKRLLHPQKSRVCALNTKVRICTKGLLLHNRALHIRQRAQQIHKRALCIWKRFLHIWDESMAWSIQEVTCSYVWIDSFTWLCCDLFICVKWLIYMCAMTYSHLWGGSFTCVLWRIHLDCLNQRGISHVTWQIRV